MYSRVYYSLQSLAAESRVDGREKLFSLYLTDINILSDMLLH